MADVPPIDIRPDLWPIVRDILHRHVPQYEVWAFGSRARSKAKPYSDLDLAIISDTPLPLPISAQMADDFSDSDLPWRVDLVDWATTHPAFRLIIARDKVVLQAATPQTAARSPCMSIKTPVPTDTPLQPPPTPPGGAAALPEGSLSKPFLGPQGDENRDPPANAPAPVSPTKTVEDSTR
jgi:predicted nucleotidyltransferase